MNDDEFLTLCENMWRLSEEAGELRARVDEIKRTPVRHSIADDLGLSRGPTVRDEIADRIEFNRVKRRLLLLRAQDIAAGLD